MQIRDIMAGTVSTIRADEPMRAAASRMKEANVGCLVVAEGESGTVQGIITDRDLGVRCFGECLDPLHCRVGDHMSSPIISAEPGMDVLEAAHLMVDQQVKRLPVMEGERLVGLVSFSDIAQAMDRPMHDLLVGMGAVRRSAA